MALTNPRACLKHDWDRFGPCPYCMKELAKAREQALFEEWSKHFEEEETE